MKNSNKKDYRDISKFEENAFISRETKDKKYKNVVIYVRADDVYEASKQEGKLIRLLDNIENINISIYRDMKKDENAILLNEIIRNMKEHKIDQILLYNLDVISNDYIKVTNFLELADENNIEVTLIVKKVDNS